MFGRSQNKKMVSASANVVCQSEDEEWEGVKPNIHEDPKAKKQAIVTVMTSDVGTSTEVAVDEQVSNSEKQVQTTEYATSVLEESEALIGVKAVNLAPTWDSTVDGIPGVIPLQEILASLDILQIAGQGNKGYFLVKRNLKTVALLLLLGVFFTSSLPNRRSKRDNVVPPPPSIDDAPKKSVDYGVLIETLKARIVEMQEMNRDAERELSMVVMERDHWRGMAMSCDNDLRYMTEMHSRVDDELKQMKSLALLDHYASSTSAVQRVNVSTLATIKEADRLPTLVPSSPPRRIPHPQLALPGKEPMYLLPKPSIKMNRPNTGIIVAPSLAVMIA
jgi:hypothetical protein